MVVGLLPRRRHSSLLALLNSSSDDALSSLSVSQRPAPSAGPSVSLFWLAVCRPAVVRSSILRPSVAFGHPSRRPSSVSGQAAPTPLWFVFRSLGPPHFLSPSKRLLLDKSNQTSAAVAVAAICIATDRFNQTTGIKHILKEQF